MLAVAPTEACGMNGVHPSVPVGADATLVAVADAHADAMEVDAAAAAATAEGPAVLLSTVGNVVGTVIVVAGELSSRR